MCGNNQDHRRKYCGAVAERLRHRSREQKVPSSIPCFSAEVTY